MTRRCRPCQQEFCVHPVFAQKRCSPGDCQTHGLLRPGLHGIALRVARELRQAYSRSVLRHLPATVEGTFVLQLADATASREGVRVGRHKAALGAGNGEIASSRNGEKGTVRGSGEAGCYEPDGRIQTTAVRNVGRQTARADSGRERQRGPPARMDPRSAGETGTSRSAATASGKRRKQGPESGYEPGFRRASSNIVGTFCDSVRDPRGTCRAMVRLPARSRRFAASCTKKRRTAWPNRKKSRQPPDHRPAWPLRREAAFGQPLPAAGLPEEPGGHGGARSRARGDPVVSNRRTGGFGEGPLGGAPDPGAQHRPLQGLEGHPSRHAADHLLSGIVKTATFVNRG